MRNSSALLAVCFAVAGVMACHGDDPSVHAPGDESFESPPPGGGSARGGTMATSGAGASSPNAVPALAPSTDGSTATRTVEEADIYQRAGSLLYVLNAYRGLQIVDLSDVSAPRLVARVAVAGRPVDLYLRASTAILAVSDVFAYQASSDGSVHPQRRSRVLAVNVADPANPIVASDLPIDGDVEQTRLVGDILYVVSRHYGWYDWAPGSGGGVMTVSTGSGSGASAPSGTTIAPGSVATGTDTVFVASFDLRDPAHPSPVAKIELPSTGWTTHANVTAERVTLSFAGYGADAQGVYGPLTRFQVIDISDAGGAMSSGASFATRGTVQDRWGMDFDAATGLFRAVVANGWNGGASLDIWSSPAPGSVTKLSHRDINVAESLTAARFDGPRVYVVTARRTDPLWAIDASDPSNPVVVGSLSMPGQLDFIEPRGDRLVALGHTDEAGQPFQLAVSLIDVAQLAAPHLLSRVAFGSSWGWVGSQPDDLRKAFIVLDPPPAGIGLVLVPVQGWDSSSYRFAGGTQLVDLARDGLTLRGFLSHPGAVTRSFPVDTAGMRLAALSDSALQTIDAANRSAPVELARLDLARSVATLAVVHGKAVELSGDWYRGAMELAVTDALDPDAATPLARVDLAAPNARIVRDGDIMWVIAQDYSKGSSWLQAIDVSDPAYPSARGRVEFSGDLSSNQRWWGFTSEAILVGHALAVHQGAWVCYDACASADGSTPGQLRVYDLSDPDHPRLASTVTLSGAAWAWGLTAAGQYLWLTHFEWNPNQDRGRYYLDRVDLTVPSQPAIVSKINVPGVFFASSEDGRRIYTLESWWSGETTTTWLHGLDLTSSGTARLAGSVQLDGYPAGTATGSGFAWTVASAWSGSSSTARLVAVDLAAMKVTSAQAVEGGWAWLRAAAGGKLFLDASWNEQGILVYDVVNPAGPTFQKFFRTPSWVWDIVVSDGRAYLPSGPYGVPVIDLH